jgi:hypothetical protein
LSRRVRCLIARAVAALYVGCIAGALPEKDYLALIEAAGFEGVQNAKTQPIRLPDMGRKITGSPALHKILCLPLALARRVHKQRQRQRGRRSTACTRPRWSAAAKFNDRAR